MKTRLGVVVAVLVLASGCMVVSGNGDRRAEPRTVGDFHGLSVGHGFQAVATLGSPASVQVEADENLLPYVETRVENGELVVTSRDNLVLTSRAPVRLTIVSPTLTEAGASGGASVTVSASPAALFSASASGGSSLFVRDLDGDRLDSAASGGARVEATGTVRTASLASSGGSRVDTTGLAAQVVRLDASGGSVGTVRASEEVTGSLSGGSIFTVVGRPARVQVATSGDSTIRLDE